MTLAVAHTQTERSRDSGKDVVGWQHDRSQPLDIGHSRQSGHGHERQKPGDHQEQQVVAGIDRREPQQQGQDDVESAGFGDFQAKGNGMRSMIVRRTIPLSEAGISPPRITSLWAQTATALFLTSSGAT